MGWNRARLQNTPGYVCRFIWGLVCAIMGLANMQETTPVKAAIAIFAPLVLCCIVWFLAWASIMALIMGSAATSGAMSQ